MISEFIGNVVLPDKILYGATVKCEGDRIEKVSVPSFAY